MHIMVTQIPPHGFMTSFGDGKLARLFYLIGAKHEFN